MQTSPNKPRVGLVTDIGRIDDGTFNQYAYEGLKRCAQELSISFEVLQTESSVDYEANLSKIIEMGCEYVLTIGGRMGAAVERFARRHPSVHFIMVDHEPLPVSTNVTGLVFAEDQAGFLAGALAGLITEQDTVGFVGGMDVTPVRKFQVGFEHGVALTNRRAAVVQARTESFTDQEAGRAAAEELVGQGADVIFAAGGLSGSAALQTAARAGAWAIGVDQDEWVTTFRNGDIPGAERLLTSAIKRVDQAVFAAVSRAVKGKLSSGVIRFNLANDGVGLASYHLADTAVPSEARGKMLEVTEGLRSGRIRTRVGPQGEEILGGFLQRVMARDWQSTLLPILAIITALIVGAVFIAAFDPEVWEAFGGGIGSGLAAAWEHIVRAYSALFEGAFGDPSRIVEGISTYSQTGDSTDLVKAIRPFTESLRIAVHLYRAGGGPGLSVWAVQHRRRGPVLCGWAGLGLCGLQPQGDALVHPPASGHCSGNGRGSILGGYRRLSEGESGGSRGDQHHHAQLCRLSVVRFPARCGRADGAPRRLSPDQP